MKPIAALILFLASIAAADNATVTGQLSSPYPTINHLALEWLIDGDANLDGVVTARYRKSGDADWKDAMPLRRVPAGKYESRTWANKHAGTIFDLAPHTEYEIALKLTDADGGSVEQSLKARTRPIPAPAPNAREIHVTPESLKDALANAQLGDILILAPGKYGKLELDKNGAENKPLILRGEGAAVFESIHLHARKHVHLESLVVEGTINMRQSRDCVVRRCTIRPPYGQSGILAAGEGCFNAYIADNTITGANTWKSESMGANGENAGDGIEMGGCGNVICFNTVRGFRDCISLVDGSRSPMQMCIDIHNNDIELGVDDGIELDWSASNCRVLRNRITNCFMGVTTQPSLGGPNYIVRNAMYNVILSPFKLHNRSTGNVILHNTCVETGDGLAIFSPEPYPHSYFRNNLIIGGEGGGAFGGKSKYANGSGLAANMPGAEATCDLDYNAYGTQGTTFAGRIGRKRFDSLEALRKIEPHAVRVTMKDFTSELAWPAPADREHATPDLRLKRDSAAIDAGVVIPNINDGHTGKGPDMGAYENGAPPPGYGPR